MLFYAIGEKRVSTLEAKKRCDYQCPECGGTVRLRGGQMRQLHFYHLKSSSSCRQSGKSPLHLKLQQKIALLIGGQMEVRFPAISRIADVCSFSKKLVVEVQCSSISWEEMEARNADYALLGLRVVWILLESRFGKQRFRFPHYFTNGQTIYDKEGKTRFVIDLAQEFTLPKIRPRIIKEREIAFHGDLSYQLLTGQWTPHKRPFWRCLSNVLLEVLTQ